MATTTKRPRRKVTRRPKAAAERPPPENLIRDRIVEFRRVSSAELAPNPNNWRTHPYSQKKALDEVLAKVGIAGAVLAYHSKRNGGKLTLIDGHERTERDAEWPTLILDVTDEEADLLLLTYDPLTGLAGADTSILDRLLEETPAPGTPALTDLLQHMPRGDDDDEEGERVKTAYDGPPGPPEMELQAFESYDYVVLLCTSSLDWLQVQERLGIGREAFTLRDGAKRRIGRGRVVNAAKLLELLDKPGRSTEASVDQQG